MRAHVFSNPSNSAPFQRPPRAPQTPARRRRGFTLVELLVVVGILAVLIGILLPVMGRAREKARQTKCLANLRSLGQAMFLYANDFRDRLPNGNPRGVWIDYDGANHVVVDFAEELKGPGVFHCPSDDDEQPEEIITAGHDKPDSARVSYEFYNLYFAPEYGPWLTRLKGRAPLAWDVDGGSATRTPVQNHSTRDRNRGGNVLFADGHAAWVDVGDWDDVSWPKPATEFYPVP